MKKFLFIFLAILIVIFVQSAVFAKSTIKKKPASAAGCCVPGCLTLDRLSCQQTGGSWTKGNCKTVSECKKGCCHPPCVQMQKWDCDMKTGEGHWCKGACGRCQKTTCPECRKGCCVPVKKQLQKWYCDQSVGEGNWHEGSCGDWKINDTFVYTSPSKKDSYAAPEVYSHWTISRVKRTITAKGQPVKPADKDEKYGYQTQWELTINDDIQLTTKNPPYPKSERNDCATEWSWTKQPSFSARVKVGFDLSSDKIFPHTDYLGKTSHGTAFTDIDIEECKFDPGQITSVETCVSPSGSVESKTLHHVGLEELGDVCGKSYPDHWTTGRRALPLLNDFYGGLTEVATDEMTTDGTNVNLLNSPWGNSSMFFEMKKEPIIRIRK